MYDQLPYNQENDKRYDLIEFVENPEPRCPYIVLVDSSASMEGEPINELYNGLKIFKQELLNNELAAKRVELAVISFNSNASVLTDGFVNPMEFNPMPIKTDGATRMCDAIKLAVSIAEARKEQYKEAGELSEIELTDTKIETSETKTELDEIKNSLSKRLTEISYYTGKNYQLNETEIADFPKYDAEPEKTENGAIKLSAEVITLRPENSLEAKSYDLEIEKKQKEYEIQKKVNFPKIRFDTRYNLYGSDTSSFFDSFQDISQRSFALRLSASFTLFDGFKNVNAVHKKRLEIEKTKAEKEKELAELKKKFDQIQLDAQNAIIQEKNNKATLVLVNKNLEMTERLNVNGLIEKSKVLRKRIELLEKKQKLEETGIRNYAAKFKLQLLAGEMEGL